MNENSDSSKPAETPKPAARARIFGVGNAGLQMLDILSRNTWSGAALVAADTDETSLSSCAASQKIRLEVKRSRGAGPGGDPELARAAAETSAAKLGEACQGAEVVFILAGLGGGAGTGICPVIAQVARERGALVLAFVTTPYDCEGNHRQLLAHGGLERLQSECDGVICLSSQRLFKLLDENTSVLEMFKLPDNLLTELVAGVWRLLAHRGQIELHFADLCALLREKQGESAFATAEASGPTRSRVVVEKLLAHPMLDGGQILADSDTVLVSLTGGPDLTITEVNRVMEQINEKCAKTQVMMGTSVDEEFRERLAVTLIAVRSGESLIARAGIDAAAHAAGSPPESLHAQLLNPRTVSRPHSRFVPPPPTLPPEKREQLIAKQSGGRGRKSSSRLRQSQLPLEIVSKGRFDKSEPTIHKGEDLDVPTYIRRGVSLN